MFILASLSPLIHNVCFQQNDNEGCERMMTAANKHMQLNDYMTKKVQLQFPLWFPFASCNMSLLTFRPCAR
jgi:hypothetical protein